MDGSRNYKFAFVQRKRRFYTRWFWASVLLFYGDLIIVLILVRRLILTDGETLLSTSRYETVLLGALAGGILVLPIFFLMTGFNLYKQLRWRSYRKPTVRYSR